MNSGLAPRDPKRNGLFMQRGTYSKERTILVKFRLTAEERQFIDEQAAEACVTVSEFVRRRAMGKRLVSRLDETVLNELRRLGGLQKHLASEYPKLEPELTQVLQEIRATLKRLG